MSIVNSKFPSAFAGQRLFIEGEDTHNNAMIGWTHFPMDLYAAGYKDAADELVKAILNHQAPIDSIIYPLVFLYRQGIELELKLMLPLARKLNKTEEKKDSKHDLMQMWQELRSIVEIIDPVEDDLELPAIEEFIKQLDEVDSGSMAFRYPKDLKGNAHLPNLKHINVRHFSNIMKSIFLMLGGIHSSLYEIHKNNSNY